MSKTLSGPYNINDVELTQHDYGPSSREQILSAASVDMAKLENDIAKPWINDPLEEIAILVQALTYGEMVELATAIWRVQPEGSAVTEENLPALLHRWSKTYGLK